ncbi:sugar ABC transporter ATP-binding protein [Roseibium sp.]|uniref:sugar ABC transporter ATP-binding protein n=1 Tax=Roseibium sp. TaxID=1936156 RepID=UPI003B50CD77
MTTETVSPLISLTGIQKVFGAVQALSGVDLNIHTGECLGLVGHNGAGKSTLMNILAGTLEASGGSLSIAGSDLGQGYAVQDAGRLGIRCVFQEGSLCPNLSVAENTRIIHPVLKGFGWRPRAAAVIMEQLDLIFPGHGVSAFDIVGDLSISKRQMVEIARAFTVTDTQIRLVILDEPTSSLDARVAEQLLDYVGRVTGEGISVILISHLLGEILQVSNKIAVMKDGRVVAFRDASGFDRSSLVEAMGSTVVAGVAPRRDAEPRKTVSEERIHMRPPEQPDDQSVRAQAGEVVGFAGLAGQGQTEALLQIFDGHGVLPSGAQDAGCCFIAGDRQVDGVLPLWSIRKNIGISSLKRLLSGLLIQNGKERELADAWKERIGIRAPDVEAPILSLSGGNQQKVLFARALGSAADIVLMDDPMRGVDIGTKNEVYAIIRQEASQGRTFLWYTTEMEELDYCDRVYVFRDGVISETLSGSDITEENVLKASFKQVSGAA